MRIYENKGITYSKYIVEMVIHHFADNDTISGTVETFYNCREQGYVLRVNDKEDYNKNMCIWICGQRNSDDPMVVWDYVLIPSEAGNRFNDDSYYNRNMCFDNVDQATKKVIELIKEYYDL